MQDTETGKALPAGLNRPSGSSGRRVQARGGAVAAGNTSWRITVLPGDGIGPEVVGATLAETIKEAVPATPVRPLKKFETLYFLMMYSAAASTLRFF